MTPTRAPDRVSGPPGGDPVVHVPGQLTLDDPLLRPRVLSLFSGYGGLDMAVTAVLGGTVVAHAEYEPPTKHNPNPTQAAARVLAHRYPDVPNLGDVTAVDWATVGPVDVITGGFPCQDVSLAGRRLGIAHDTRSGLWGHMAAAVDSLRPRLVVIENVRGLLSARARHPAHSDVEPCPWCLGRPDELYLRALGAVVGDLSDLGYDAAWSTVRAADVGAPHGRARVFVLAWPADADPDGVGREWAGQARRRGSGSADERRQAADADGAGLESSGAGRPPQAGIGGAVRRGLAAADPDDGTDDRQRARAEPRDGGADRWGPYAAAVRRWAAVLGRDAPPPTEPSTRGAQRLSPAFVEWMMGLPAGWVTDVPGIGRNDALRLLGNGVVPQQAAAAVASLLADVAAPPADVEGAA